MRQVLFHLPGVNLPIFGFGAMLLVAFFSATWLISRRAKLEGIDPNRLSDMALWIFIWGIIGARVFYMAEHREEFDGIASFFKIWRGGIVFYGAVIAGIIVYFYYTRKYRMSAWSVLDVFAPATALGVGFGRIGCLLNGCCWGKPTELSWGIQFPAGSIPWQDHVNRGWIGATATLSRPVHPTQLYMAFDGFLILGLLLAYHPWARGKGTVMALAMVSYGVTRFLVEFLRGDVPPLKDGLTISQNISVVLLLGGIVMGWARWPARNTAAADPS